CMYSTRTLHDALPILFIILSILMTIGALLALFIPSNKQFAAIKTKRKRKLSFHDFFEKKALPVAFLASLIGLSYASILSYISIRSEEHTSELQSRENL